VFKEAHEVSASIRQTKEDTSVRNVAFSILLGALALLQVAVVAAELSPSGAQTAKVANSDVSARYVLVSSEAGHKRSAF
jgi:hypothetical protein